MAKNYPADTVEGATREDLRSSVPSGFYRNIANRNGFLRSKHPVAKAIHIERDPLGEGAQGTVYEAFLDLEKLKSEENGYRSLLLPVLLHQHLGRNPTSNGLYVSAEQKAKEELRSMSEDLVKSTFDDFCKKENILPENHVAVKFSFTPAQMDIRDPRLSRLVGLSHKNFVYHFAHGQTETGFPFLIMEYMDGALSPEDTCNRSTHFYLHVLKSLISAGEEIKPRGIVHRDIKPDNVFYRKRAIKLADFGLMSDDNDEEKRTATGMSMGTILYMPPEQVIDAKRATWQSDQFAMGATLYHLMTNIYPLQTKSKLDAMTRMQLERAAVDREKIQSILTQNDIQKEGIEQILARMMQSVPQKRYPDYQQIIEDIRRVEQGKLPKNASPKLTGTTFRLSDYSNHYSYRKQNILRTAVLATTAAGIGAAAYLGYIDSLINFAIKLSQ